MIAFKGLEEGSSFRIIQLAIILSALLTALISSFVATEQPIVAVLGIAALAVSIASLRWPDVTTLTFFFILLTNTATIAVKFHNVPFAIGAAFPLLLFVPVVNHVVLRRQKLVLTPYFLLLVCLLLVQLIGTLFARNLNDAFDNLIVFAVEAVMIYFLVINAIRTPQTLRRVVNVFLLSAILLGAVPIYQQITGTYVNDYWGYGQVPGKAFTVGQSLVGGDTQARLAGAIGEKNRFAQFMMMFGMIAITQVWGARTKSERIIAIIATVTSFTAAVLPFSRGAAIGFVLTLLVAVPLSFISVKQFVAIVLAGAVALAAFPQYSARLISIPDLLEYAAGSDAQEVDGSTKGRITEMLAALTVYAEHPIVGVGPKQYRFYSKEVGNDLGIKRLDEDRQAHNLYLDTAANTGTLGLVLTLWIIFMTLWQLFKVKKRWQEKRPNIASLATGFSLAIIVYLTTGIFLHDAYLRYIWTFMAVAGTIILVANKLEESDFEASNKMIDAA
ncbi:MAG: O-antigen ligase family protein [Chloroflexi bacterium]|nr:O-antigen ligase family protein [Chloroflexota bacterium]